MRELINKAKATLKNRPETTYKLQLADEKIVLNSFGNFNSSAYLNCISHRFKGFNTAKKTLEIDLIESSSTGNYPPETLINWKKIDPYSGELLGLSEDFCIVFNSSQLSLIWVDFPQKKIIFWVNQFADLPHNETAAPLRQIFQIWFRNSKYFLCHAAGLGNSGSGVLLTGKGGSGKSTSTLACLNSSLKYAGDDFLLVDSENCIAHSLYGVAKLNSDQFVRFPELAKHISNVEFIPKEKGQVYIHEVYPDQILLSFKIHFILLPKFSFGQKARFEVCPKAELMKALIPSSVWILRANKDALAPMINFINKLPAFYLHTNENLDEIRLNIEHLLYEN